MSISVRDFAMSCFGRATAADSGVGDLEILEEALYLLERDYIGDADFGAIADMLEEARGGDDDGDGGSDPEEQ